MPKAISADRRFLSPTKQAVRLMLDCRQAIPAVRRFLVSTKASRTACIIYYRQTIPADRRFPGPTKASGTACVSTAVKRSHAVRLPCPKQTSSHQNPAPAFRLLRPTRAIKYFQTPRCFLEVSDVQESAIYFRTRRGIPTLSATRRQAATSSSPTMSTTENQHSIPARLHCRAKSRIAV